MSLDALRSYGLNVGPVAASLSGLDDLRQMPSRLKALEDAGITMTWYGETFGHEAFTFGQRLLYASERIVVGTGIARALEREPKNAASAQWTITEEFPNRYVMGLGASAATKERGKGTVQFLRDYLVEVDANTERLTGKPGRYPRVLGAYSVGTISLSRDMCDGLTTFLTTADHTKWAREVIGPDRFLTVNLSVIPGEAHRAREIMRERLVYYLKLPHQINKFRNMGFKEEDFAPPGSDALIDGLIPHGPMDVIIERLREHLRNGADQVNIHVLGTDPNKEIDYVAEINQELTKA